MGGVRRPRELGASGPSAPCAPNPSPPGAHFKHRPQPPPLPQPGGRMTRRNLAVSRIYSSAFQGKELGRGLRGLPGPALTPAPARRLPPTRSQPPLPPRCRDCRVPCADGQTEPQRGGRAWAGPLGRPGAPTGWEDPRPPAGLRWQLGAHSRVRTQARVVSAAPGSLLRGPPGHTWASPVDAHAGRPLPQCRSAALTFPAPPRAGLDSVTCPLSPLRAASPPKLHPPGPKSQGGASRECARQQAGHNGSYERVVINY